MAERQVLQQESNFLLAISKQHERVKEYVCAYMHMCIYGEIEWGAGGLKGHV